MRRLMLGMSQEKLADGLGLTFQQVQKYEKGANRIGASRLQQIAQVLQVEPAFFFDGVPQPQQTSGDAEALSPAYLTEFLSTADGLALVGAFQRIRRQELRRSIVKLVEGIAQA